MSTRGKQSKPTRQGNSSRREVEKKVPMKISPIRNNQVEYSGEKRLGKHTAVIMIAALGQTDATTFTIHRPLGMTKLARNDWVLTEQSELPSLLARLTHPEANKINLLRENRFHSDATLKDLLIVRKDDEGKPAVYYKTQPPMQKPRKVFMDKLDECRKEYTRRALEVWDEENPSKDEPTKDQIKSRNKKRDGFRKNLHFPWDYCVQTPEFKSFEAGLGIKPGVIAQAEKNLQDFRRVRFPKIVEEIPDNFETCGGISNDKPQRAIPGARGKDLEAAVDHVKIVINAVLTGQDDKIAGLLVNNVPDDNYEVSDNEEEEEEEKGNP